MRLKIFVFPLFLIVAFFVGFNFIKPEYDAWQVKRDEKAGKQAELDSVQQTLKNIDALSQSLVSHEKDVAFVHTYLPLSQNEERTLDAINFIATGSGVILQNVRFDEKNNAPTKNTETEETSSVDPITGNPINPTLLPPTIPEPMTFSLDIVFAGSYEGMRHFLSDIQKINQLHSVTAFSIGKLENQDKAGESSESSDSGMLQASLTADFYYLPMKTFRNAHLLDIFKRDSMDFSPMSRISDANGFIPNLPQVDGFGRGNPFNR